MRRTSAALAGAVAAVLALAGCSDDEASPEPTNEPSTSPSAVPSPTPTAAAPTLAPEAATPDAAGAEAFVRHWFALVNHGYLTGDVTALGELSLPDCETCASVIGTISEGYEADRQIVGGRITVDAASATAPDPAGMSLVSLAYSQAPIQILNPDDSVYSEAPAAQGIALAFYARMTDGQWRARGVAQES